MAAESEASSQSVESVQSIILKVKSQENGGDEIFFKQKISTAFRKMFNEYHAKKGRPQNYYVFLYDGRKLKEWQTPEEYEMEVDGANEPVTVDALHIAHGGAGGDV